MEVVWYCYWCGLRVLCSVFRSWIDRSVQWNSRYDDLGTEACRRDCLPIVGFCYTLHKRNISFSTQDCTVYLYRSELYYPAPHPRIDRSTQQIATPRQISSSHHLRRHCPPERHGIVPYLQRSMSTNTSETDDGGCRNPDRGDGRGTGEVVVHPPDTEPPKK